VKKPVPVHRHRVTMIHGFVVMARLGALDNIYRRTYAVKMGGSINRAGPVTGVPGVANE
jgi:hypothetical protein